MAFHVAAMFVTDGKPSMQNAKFTEDMRDDDLEPWQPVAAHRPAGFSVAVLGVSVLRWQMQQQKQTGPRYSRDGYKTDRKMLIDGGGSRDCAFQAAGSAHLS